MQSAVIWQVVLLVSIIFKKSCNELYDRLFARLSVSQLTILLIDPGLYESFWIIERGPTSLILSAPNGVWMKLYAVSFQSAYTLVYENGLQEGYCCYIELIRELLNNCDASQIGWVFLHSGCHNNSFEYSVSVSINVFHLLDYQLYTYSYIETGRQWVVWVIK